MTTIDEGLVAALRAASAVQALIANTGSPVTYRLTHGERPQKQALPAATWNRNGTDQELLLDGPSSLVRGAYTVEVFAATSAACRSLAAAVRAALSGVTGNLGGARVHAVWCTNESDLGEVEGDTTVRQIALDFDILYPDQ